MRSIGIFPRSKIVEWGFLVYHTVDSTRTESYIVELHTNDDILAVYLTGFIRWNNCWNIRTCWHDSFVSFGVFLKIQCSIVQHWTCSDVYCWLSSEIQKCRTFPSQPNEKLLKSVNIIECIEFEVVEISWNQIYTFHSFRCYVLCILVKFKQLIVTVNLFE